jgi:flagellar hook-basal body complex protein FliE
VSKDYRIHASDIVEKGVQQVVFNPDLIEVFVSDKQIGEWGGEGYQRVSVVYKDEDLAQLMAVNNYYIDWAKTIFKGDHQDRYRHNRKAIKFHKSLSVKLRKKPNVKGYTQKSIDAFEEKAKAMVDKYTDVDFITEELRKLISDFNKWYAEEQRNKVVKAYSDIYSWKWETVEEIVAMDEEIKAMQEKLNELRNKKFDRQCTLAVEFVKDKAEKIAEEFKQPLIEAINEKRAEGYQSPFFR